jgi:hypothetical protein
MMALSYRSKKGTKGALVTTTQPHASIGEAEQDLALLLFELSVI